jgi:hypothetical protein
MAERRDLSPYAARQRETHRVRNFALGTGALLVGGAGAYAAYSYGKSVDRQPTPVTPVTTPTGPADVRPTVGADGGLVIPSLPAPENRAQVGGIAVPAYHSDLPVCLINPDGRLQAEGINVYQQAQWFRPVYDVGQVNPDADQWRGVGSWGVAVSFASQDAYLKTKGHVGELTVRVKDNLPKATFAFGIMTNGKHIDEMKHGENGVVNPAWDMGAWIRTQPGAVLTMVDPDTGKPYMRDGNPVTIQANDHGDAGIILPREGRVAFVVTVTTAPGDHPFETNISFGPNDKDYMDGNIVDMQRDAAKPAITDQRPK